MKKNLKELICTAFAESRADARMGSLSSFIISVLAPMVAIPLFYLLPPGPYSSFCGLAAIGWVFFGNFLWKVFWELPRREASKPDLRLVAVEEGVSEHARKIDQIQADLRELRSTIDVALPQHLDAGIWHLQQPGANTAVMASTVN